MKSDSIFGLPDQSLDMIKNTLAQYPEVKEAIIFGSRAMGNYKKGSDVDIALKGNISQDTLLKIYVKLDQELPLPYKCDIVDYHAITNSELKTHIDQYGVPFFPRP